MADLSAVLACPTCGTDLENTGSSWRCRGCSLDAPESRGVVDFLHDVDRLPAASDTLDLVSDRKQAAQMIEMWEGSSFDDLHIELGRLRAEAHPITPDLRRAQERFERGYARVAGEVGFDHGRAILWKIDSFLQGIGQSPPSGGWALEGAGGHGFFLPDFSKRFENLVFLDALMVHILLAQKLVEERGIAGVRFVRADITNLPFRPGAFDFVHENGIIEHVADPQAMVDEGIRVTSNRGLYVCLSPNRYTFAPEPHFRLPFFGFIPRRLRRALLPRVRGITSEEGTDLRSLGELRSYLALAGHPDAPIFFLPRGLPETARSTGLRRVLKTLLRGPLGGPISWTLNKVFLFGMPYHIALVSRPD